MHVTITNPPGDGIRQMKAILDSIEPGAGGHCLFHHTVPPTNSTPQIEIWRHVRLNITVHVEYPAPTPDEPWWVTAQRWNDLEAVS